MNHRGGPLVAVLAFPTSRINENLQSAHKNRAGNIGIARRVWIRHFPDEIERPNTPSCRSQKVGIIKCKSRADGSKPVGLLVRPPSH